MPTTQTQNRVTPNEVHDLLRRHMLVDGYDLVLDLEKSRGPFLHDSRSGRELLDFFGSFSTVPLGYNHEGMDDPAFRERILRAAINKPANSDLYTLEMAEFVEAFSSTVPAELDRHLFFISGGGLAVENALKAAFDWKQRKNQQAGRSAEASRILHFKEAFHGRTGYTMSLTNTDPTKTLYFPKFESWPRVHNPKLRFPIDEHVLLDVEAAERRSLADIHDAITRYGHTIAGIILEPIQGEGGDNHFRPEFLAVLREIADQHEMLLIFDEVQTGFGTTGSWWCFEQLGVAPDIFAFGKKTQVCGVAAGPRLDEVDSVFHVPSRINSTWGGNLVDMVRCHRIVTIVKEEGLLERAQSTGKLILEGLEALEQRFPGQVTNARGRGLFLALDLPDNRARERALTACLEHGLLALASGARSLRFRPPLILDEDAAREGLSRLGEALESVLAG